MINLSLTPTDAALVLAALQYSARDCINAPQINALIDTFQNEINLAEREADADERDLFRSDAEADGDALAYAWDFDDTSLGPNAASAVKSWPAPRSARVRWMP